MRPDGGAGRARTIIVIVARNQIGTQRRAHRRTTVLALAPRLVDCPAFGAVARNRGAVERAPLVPSPPSDGRKIDDAVAFGLRGRCERVQRAICVVLRCFRIAKTVVTSVVGPGCRDSVPRALPVRYRCRRGNHQWRTQDFSTPGSV